MRPPALVIVLSVAALLLGGIVAVGCGSSDSGSGSSAKTDPADVTVTGTVPAGRLGADGDPKTEICGPEFHFSTERDEVAYLQVVSHSCAFAKQLATDYSNGVPLPEGWRCTTWVQDGHQRNDASVACSAARGEPGAVGFTVKWL